MKGRSQHPQRILALLVALIMGTGTAFAEYDFAATCVTGQTLYYNIIDATNHYVEFTFPGDDAAHAYHGYGLLTGNITLPSRVTHDGVTYTVTNIGQYAFRHCPLSGELVIPSTVTAIGKGAFEECSDFTGSLTIPNSVTTIAAFAFYHCSGFTGSLTIGNSVTHIDQQAFKDCTGFTGTLTIPASVTSLSWFVFSNCSGFTTVNYNAVNCGAVEAEYKPFEGCGGALNIGNSVYSIPAYLFRDAGFTGTLTIPSSVTSIGAHAFRNCTGFTQVNYNAINCEDVSSDATPFENCVGTLNIGENVQHIPANMFYGTGFTGTLNIPSSVTSIGAHAFKNCTGFTQVNYKAINCEDVSSNANPFECCLGTLNIQENVQHIPAYMFCASGFTGSVYIPSTVTSIGERAFKNCSGFTKVEYAAINCADLSMTDKPFDGFLGTISFYYLVQRIPAYLFYQCTGLTGPLNMGGSRPIVEIGQSAFRGCIGLTGTLALPNTLTTIGQSAFEDCSGLTGSLFIPNAVTEIGVSAFENCSGFTGSLTLPSTLTSISNNAFYDCGFTGALAIPNGVTTIGVSAFAACDGFTSLTLPASVTSLVNYAFSGCTGLTRMTVFSTTPPTVGATTFSSVTKTIPVFVPCSALEDYQTASGWSTFTNMQCLEMLTYSINDDGVSVTVTGHVDGSSATGPVVIPETTTINGVTYTVTAIGDYAFDNCQGLTGSLIIPNTVTTIGNDAFNWCTGFDGTLTIGSSVTTIGEEAFYACSGFTGSLIIPNSVTTIGANAFHYDSGFDGALILGTSLSSIGFAAFNGCSGFTGALTLPSTLTTIGNSAFANCSGFTGALVIPDGVATIGNSAFVACSGLTSLILPASVTSLERAAFGDCTGLTTMTVLPATPPTLANYAFRNVPTTIPVIVPCPALEDYQAASGWSVFTNLQCDDPLTYSINDDGVSVTVTGHRDGNVASGELFIPETKTIDGVTYAVTAIGDEAFKNYLNLTGDLIIPNSVTKIGNGAFWNCHIGGSLTLSNSLTLIGDYAFYDCFNLTGSLTIPNTVVEIGSYAFQFCSKLTGSLTIPNSVTTIGTSAFSGCSGFTGSLTIGNSVTTIGNYAFWSCSGFTGSLTIGNSVSSIGSSAFSGCHFSSMTVLPVTPPALGTVAFSNLPTVIPVYVPCESLEDYQTATGWSAFTNLQCFPETLTVCDGTVLNNSIPAYIYFFDDFTCSQFVIPASDLVEMTGSSVVSMTFYTNSTNVPYTTVSNADVYLKEVDYTQIDAFEPKSSAATVYSGHFIIESTEEGGMMTIYFTTPYTYQGGNLLVGVENTEDLGARYIRFYGKTASGASIVGRSTTSGGTMTATQQNFIPKTTFGFHPVCEPKTLPYTYGFEEEDDFYDCWTLLNCDGNAGRTESDHFNGNYGFLFWYTENPPQYLVSPKLECTTDVDVSFYYRNDGNEWPETFQVGYSTSTKSPSAFTWGDELTAQNSTWTRYENTFPEGTKYVAIKHLSYDQNVLFLDDFSFVSASQGQTVALAAGANYVSFNVETTLVDLQTALTDALGTTGVTMSIKSQTEYTELKRGHWTTGFNNFNVSEMFIINVSAACEITLTGTPINPAEHPVTMVHGANWIAYPLSQPMTITNVFTGFVGTNDALTSQTQYSKYIRGKWSTEIELQPGQGYIYESAATGDRTFTFPTSK